MSATKVNGSSTNANDNSAAQANEVDKTCVVCFKIVDIFSVGECDHPVCYECSTRMRVLCKQNECPICRRINQKVIFTSEILPYRELDKKNRSCLYDKTFRICFSGQRTQNAFQRLLEHLCSKCNKEPFETAAALKDHLRREHELFYCDICTEHLKIFSFERRAYTREQLAQHRRKGDADNKSHRGHPLCEYCDERYLDRDELFRHLRKEHYFCHFCDADGSNQFYADHTSLREHFLGMHHLCEEGDCRENIFTAAFRSDIDLKAHKASVHGQTSKQARTIEFQFNLAPRNRNFNQNRQEEVNSSNNIPPQQANSTSTFAPSTSHTVIDARNEQEFPSLGNASVTIRPNISLNTRSFGTSGLARTKENFPALGGSDPIPRVNPIANSAKVSAFLFKTPAPAKPAVINSKKNFKNDNAKPKTSIARTANDFPALPGSSSHSANKNYKDLETDLIEAAPAYNLSTVSSKHRALVQSYESVSLAAQSNQKIKTVQQTEAKKQSTINESVPSINSKKSFPALGGGSSIATAPQWLNASTVASTKKPLQMSKKLKVAPAPLLPTTNENSNGTNDLIKKNGKSADKSNSKSKPTTQKVKENGNVSKQTSKNGTNKSTDKDDTRTNKENKEKNTKNEVNPNNGSENSAKKAYKNSINNSNTNSNSDHSHVLQNGNATINETINSYSSVATFTMPPPGFPAKANQKLIKAPPGFESTVTELRQLFAYISPSNALLRNQILVSHFTKSLKPAAVEEFRNVSKLFREGSCNARAYYEHCEIVLGNRFESIFPELLVLLPDISKQQELYEVYTQNHSESNSNLNGYIQVCDLCRQVLKCSDFSEHWQNHIDIEKDNKLNKNFPKLSIAKK